MCLLVGIVVAAQRGRHQKLKGYFMKTFVLAAAAAAIVALPAIAIAQTAPAPLVCHTASATETSNAAMGSTKLVCRPVDMAKVMAAEKSLMGMMPKTMTDAQMQQMQAAQDTINSEFNLPKVPGGTTQSDR
jgi:hypothetical protein